MEYYHYINIFETKGLEYVLVISFLITFVFFVIKLEVNSKLKGNPVLSADAADGQVPIVVVDDSTAAGKPGTAKKPENPASKQPD